MFRFKARETVNLVFTSSVNSQSARSLKSIVEFLTGKTIIPGTAAIIIGPEHELRLECQPSQTPFTLCPLDTKTPESTLQRMDTEKQQAFERAMQNLNRFEIKRDQEGQPTNSLSKYAGFELDSGDPLFNQWTGFVFFNVTVKSQRMEKLMQMVELSGPGKHSLKKLFGIRTPNGELLMGPGLMALQDYYMATAFWAKMRDLSEKRGFYILRLAQYQRLDGKDGRRDMRAELQLALESYLDTHPEMMLTVRKSRSRQSDVGGDSVDLTASIDEIDKWATGPAGGGFACANRRQALDMQNVASFR
jgi:hypothetical protein